MAGVGDRAPNPPSPPHPLSLHPPVGVCVPCNYTSANSATLSLAGKRHVNISIQFRFSGDRPPRFPTLLSVQARLLCAPFYKNLSSGKLFRAADVFRDCTRARKRTHASTRFARRHLASCNGNVESTGWKGRRGGGSWEGVKGAEREDARECRGQG